MDAESLERHRGDQVYAAALDGVLAQRRLDLGVVLLLVVPHHVDVEVLVVECLALRRAPRRRVLCVAEAVDLRRRHRAPSRHQEEVARVLGQQALRLGLHEECVAHVGEVSEVEAGALR